MNPAFERIWGQSRDRLYRDPRSMLEAVHPEDRERVERQFLNDPMKGAHVEDTFRLRRPDGAERWLHVHRYQVPDEDGRVSRVAGTAVDITDLKQVELELQRANAELKRQAYYDRLTGVANRHYFETLLNRELARADRYGAPFALVMFDLDHFKRVNDTFGHAAGDVVLQEVTRVIAERLRDADVLGRWGGEEFMVLLPGTQEADAARVAETMRARVEGHDFPEAGRVTISLGVAAFCAGEPRTGLLRRVDEALYRAKGEGRNRVAVAASAEAIG